jgi:hypothetical protein
MATLLRILPNTDDPVSGPLKRTTVAPSMLRI